MVTFARMFCRRCGLAPAHTLTHKAQDDPCFLGPPDLRSGWLGLSASSAWKIRARMGDVHLAASLSHVLPTHTSRSRMQIGSEAHMF